jgi:ABC-type phosphate/phosphonate transport system ATPase subunit
VLDGSGVEQAFPDSTRTLYDLLLRVRDGEFVSVVGPLDGGRDTLLRRP